MRAAHRTACAAVGAAVVLAAVVLAACGCSPQADTPPPTVDLRLAFAEDLGEPPGPDPCSDADPACTTVHVGPAYGAVFSLPTDPMPDPNALAIGVVRAPGGGLRIGDTAAFDFAWIAHDDDGTVSKLDTRTMKEVARYKTVTCFSRAAGSFDACDGKGGCCAADSDPEWQSRKAGRAPGPAQQVQLTANSPSRTAIDDNGDLFIANRAFAGQASVTKIANAEVDCRDLDKNGRIDTSRDRNGDGRIDPNDPAEYLDLADECILWTTNHGGPGAVGRPLGLGPGLAYAGPPDAWAGEYNTGKFFRIDGQTGRIRDEVQLPGSCNPYGVVVDASGIAWAPALNAGALCFFNTTNNKEVGVARDPVWGKMAGYGVTLDRDQDVWVGGAVARYEPDRSRGFATFGQGVWTRIGDLVNVGIAADSRSAGAYFVWSASAKSITRIPASAIPRARMDTVIGKEEVAAYPVVTVPAYGVGIDADQNLIAVPAANVVYRVKVDALGNATPPDVTSPPAVGERCPAGDRCDLGSHAYTYSDFTGFGMRHFSAPGGTYSYVFTGCRSDGASAPTQWHSLAWSGDTPPGTAITVRARAGWTPVPGRNWGAFSDPFAQSPVDLRTSLPDAPSVYNGYLEVQARLVSGDRALSPTLRGIEVKFRCGN